MAPRTFPGFSRIYVLEEAGNSIAFRGDFSPGDDAFAITRGERDPGRVEIRWAMGRKKPSDVIKTTSVAPIILARRVIDLLKDARFTGWRSYDVEVFSKTGELIPDYCGLAVHGRCGPIDGSKNVKIDKPYPGGIFPVWRGICFNPDTWDGSDLFMPAGDNAWKFVLEPVKRAFEKARVRNVVFTALEEIELPMSP